MRTTRSAKRGRSPSNRPERDTTRRGRGVATPVPATPALAAPAALAPTSLRFSTPTPTPHPFPGGAFPPRLGASPLRLLITGSNPSAASAAAGHAYAHPTNRMWPILRATGLAPPGLISGPADDVCMPALAGVGFLDVGHGHAETQCARLTPSLWAAFVPAYFSRLTAHAAAAAVAAGCVCGRGGGGGGGASSCGAPGIIAFAGKAQWQALFKAAGVAAPPCQYGSQPAAVRPPGWPWPVGSGGGGPAVWVLTSTSGAAALSNEAREAPWRALAAAVGGWPRGPPACRGR